jgi:hypothetical protein
MDTAPHPSAPGNAGMANAGDDMIASKQIKTSKLIFEFILMHN